jgi:hypothetical protein
MPKADKAIMKKYPAVIPWDMLCFPLPPYKK